MIKKLILLTTTCIGSLFGSNPFLPMIDDSWEVLEESGYWFAERNSIENNYLELLGYNLIPMDHVDFESLDELLDWELALAEDLGQDLEIHYSSESMAHISWTFEFCDDWIEWGTTLIRCDGNNYAAATYQYQGKDLEKCSTNQWLTLFAQEIEIVLSAESIAAQ